MSGSTDSFLAARFLTADYLVRGRDNPLSCPLWLNGVLSAPTQSGSTVSVYDTANQAVVNAAAVTVASSIATYTVPASVLPTSLSLGMGWRVEWSLIVSGAPKTFRNNAGLVRSELVPVLTDRDLFRRESSLNPAASSPLTALTTYQDYRDEAWIVIHGLLTGKGSLAHLIMEPSALREPHMLLTLALIYEDLRTTQNEVFAEKAREYRDRFEKAFSELRFEYDTTDSGRSDGRRKRSANPTVFLCGRG